MGPGDTAVILFLLNASHPSAKNAEEWGTLFCVSKLRKQGRASPQSNLRQNDSHQEGDMTSRLLLAVGLTMHIGWATAQSTYTPPKASAAVVSSIAFQSSEPVDAKFHNRFTECDHHDVCDGNVLTKHKCSTDPSRNTVFLKLAGGVVFYDAKMGIDADGSKLSKDHPGETDQPDTAFRYPLPGSPSLNADKVPYIVIPGGNFEKPLGIETGDIGAVVYQDHLVYAIVGDSGPKCKIGEGSIELLEKLGHRGCAKRDSQDVCITPASSGIEKDVLYFIFPGSKATIFHGLTPDNINERIITEGEKLMGALKNAAGTPQPPASPSAVAH
jgi:hypothetical protein